jgi:hypothetical protein
VLLVVGGFFFLLYILGASSEDEVAVGTSLSSSVFIYYWNLFLYAVCDVLCAGCCITLRVLQVHAITVVLL